MAEVTGLKYGTESIRFDMFHIGRKHILELQTKDQEISIQLKSFFGIRSVYFAELHSKILNCIYNDIMVRLVNEALDNLVAGKEISISQCNIVQNGILIKNKLTTWQDLSFQRNYDRLTLNNKLNPKVWTSLYYTKTYNVDVLAAILDWTLNQNGIAELIRE